MVPSTAAIPPGNMVPSRSILSSLTQTNPRPLPMYNNAELEAQTVSMYNTEIEAEGSCFVFELHSGDSEIDLCC